MSWDKPPDMFGESVLQDVDKRARGLALTCLNSIIRRSPVDTGRFRGSHVVSINQPSYELPNIADKTGSLAMQVGASSINGAPVGAVSKIYIQTNLPYANRIENGWSKQAADGVYAVSFNHAVQVYK